MINFIRIWILLSALLVSSGWILSGLHELNRAGYAVIFGIVGVILIWWLRKNKIFSSEIFRRTFLKFRRRFKRLPPFLFLILALLTLIAGSLYPAVNWDANCYRLPRIFHWLWENQWHWIYTSEWRMNIAACGYEWLAAPLVLFSGGDRLLFLINWVSFLMLPGLIFSFFIQLQICRRVAWWWMWFLSAGWCFVLEAGSVANDSFAAIYALAMVNLALRARQNGKVTDVWLSLLAAALLTDTKQTNLPLVALWLAAAWPSLRLLRSKPFTTVAVACFGVLISVAPVSFFNFKHYGTWFPLQHAGLADIEHFRLNPFWGIVGNIFCIPAQNLWPPFSELLPPFYGYALGQWNATMSQFLNTPFGGHFASFEKFGYLNLSHGTSEESAGIGLGICVLMLATFYEKWRLRKLSVKNLAVEKDIFLLILRCMPWALCLFFMAKVGTYENARQFAPYYIFLFPLLLVGSGQEIVSRQREWQNFGIAVMLLAIFMVITVSARPLFPAQTIFKNLHKRFPGNEIILEECCRYFDYSYYRAIELRRAQLKALLSPLQEKIIGYCPGIHACDEPAIWLPYGRQSAHWILPGDSLDQLHQLQIHYVVVNSLFLTDFKLSLSDWMNQYHAVLIGECDDASASIPYGTSTHSLKLYVVRIN